MVASFLTALFFALSAIFASRTARQVGAVAANFARQWVAIALLAVWAHGFRHGLHGAGLPVFILSGIVGFGFGDLALFASFPLIGPRLAALMVQCLAAPFAAVIEWLWLGATLTGPEMLCGAAILAGVGVAIAPEKLSAATSADPRATVPTLASRRQWNLGLCFGVLAALGQAGGAVLSRRANQLSAAAGFPVDGGVAAYQRLWGGLLVVSIAYGAVRWRQRRAAKILATPNAAPIVAAPDWAAAWPWIIANAVSGAVLGVSCYQWALATTKSAIVLPIVALTPLVVIPFAYFLERERPSHRSILGGLLAVAAAAAMVFFQNHAR